MWGELFASDSENRVLQLVLQTEMAMEMLNQRKLMYLLELLEVQLHAFFYQTLYVPVDYRASYS